MICNFRNLPIAIWFSCVLVTVIYVLANVAYFTTVTPDEIVGASAVAVVRTSILHWHETAFTRSLFPRQRKLVM